MKSYGGLWQGITSLEALRAAMARAARQKANRNPVRKFLDNADNELGALQRDLQTASWRPSPFVQFPVLDPKPRLISCAAFRDRVVHHSLCDAIGPLLERSFIPDSFACRLGKGANRAIFRAQAMARRWEYFGKLDIRKYFDSIDHEILLSALQPRFREASVRSLLETIIRFPLPGQQPGKGLPIGNLTSQWFANTYLDACDHHALETLRVGGYLRYMDDVLIFDRSPQMLNEQVGSLATWLKDQRALAVKTERLLVGACRTGVPFLGWRVFPGFIRLQPERRKGSRGLLRRREREFRAGTISAEKLTESVQAIVAGVRAVRPGFRFDRWGFPGLES